MDENAGKEQTMPGGWAVLAPLSCLLPLRSNRTAVELPEGETHSCSEMIFLHSPLRVRPAVL